jgi:hypothetical protein
MRKPKAFAILAASFFLLWVFGVYVGPWLAKRIPVMNEIVQIIEEREINANAYFYTEIEASYDGERYMIDALELSPAEEGRVGWFFVAGVAYCLVLLWFGFHKLPLD